MKIQGIALPLDKSSFLHICVDMQLLFTEGRPWSMPWGKKILPSIVAICEKYPEQTIFTRFIPVVKPDNAIGAWKEYYKKWPSVTLTNADPELMQLIPPLRQFIPPATILDKKVYSPWTEGALDQHLKNLDIKTLIITGAETDVCILATVLGAVDRGYHVIIVEDAVSSSFDATHDAALKIYRNRFSEQIHLVNHQSLLNN